MTRPLSADQNEILAYASLRQCVAMASPRDDGRCSNPDAPTWRATCGCGSVVMQPLSGRAGRGLEMRGLVRLGPRLDHPVFGAHWARMILTDQGRAAVKARRGAWPSWLK